MPFQLKIPRAIYEAMLAHAQAELPNECVGMLAGQPDGLVVEHYPLVNALADPRRCESEPRSTFEAEKRRRDRNLEFLAVYHSHPTSLPIPSQVDLDPDVNFWLDSGVVSVIISLLPPEPMVKAYWLTAKAYQEAEWQVIP
jgi:proteasome lid subunit RPN8/RPN11